MYVGTEVIDAAIMLIQKSFPVDNCAFYNSQTLRLILSGQQEIDDKAYFIGIMPR